MQDRFDEMAKKIVYDWNQTDHNAYSEGVLTDNELSALETHIAAALRREGGQGIHMKNTIRAGDAILHKPSGEKWKVAAVSPNGTELVCCGWPETIAEVEDCELVRSATDDEHREILADVISSCQGQLRASWAAQELARDQAKEST